MTHLNTDIAILPSLGENYKIYINSNLLIYK